MEYNEEPTESYTTDRSINLDLFEGYLRWSDQLEDSMNSKDSGPLYAGRYKIIKELGRGGCGGVYEALDTKSDCLVALKTVRPDEDPPLGPLRILVDEIELNSKILEKVKQAQFGGRLVPILDFAIPKIVDAAAPLKSLAKHLVDKPVYMTMPIYRQSLKDLLHDYNHRLPAVKATRIMKSVAESLAELHKFSREDDAIIHRDLKPANILIDEHENPWLADFGLALERRTQDPDHQFAGTRSHASPEQIDGGLVTTQADIWAWGVIFYQLLIGMHPFEDILPGDRTKGELKRYRNELKRIVPPSPADFKEAAYSQKVSDLILSCLSVKPADRPKDFYDVSAKLEEANAPPLREDRRSTVKDQVDSPSSPVAKQGTTSIDDLQPEVEWLDFVPRPELMQQLESFLDDPEPFLWWGIIGKGGTGKSRLAQELIKQLRLKEHWAAFFLSDNNRTVDKWLENKARYWEPNFPTLLILDYANLNAIKMFECLDELAQRAKEEKTKLKTRPKIRFLFLDRPGNVESSLSLESLSRFRKNQIKPSDFDKVAKLVFDPNEGEDSDGNQPSEAGYKTASSSSFKSKVLVTESQLMRIEGLAADEQKSQLREVLKQVLIRTGSDDPESALPDEDNDEAWEQIARLTDSGRPLFLQILGICLADKSVTLADLTAGQDNLEFLLDKMLKHERKDRWGLVFSGVKEKKQPIEPLIEQLERLVGFITLSRGVPHGFADSEKFKLSGIRDVDEIKTVLPLVLKPYQEANDQKMHPALQPDLLGERLVVHLASLSDSQEDNGNFNDNDSAIDLEAWVKLAFELNPEGLLQTIGLITEDFPKSPGTVAWLKTLLVLIQRREIVFEESEAYHYAISVALSTCKLIISQVNPDKELENLLLEMAHTSQRHRAAAIAVFLYPRFSELETIALNLVREQLLNVKLSQLGDDDLVGEWFLAQGLLRAATDWGQLAVKLSEHQDEYLQKADEAYATLQKLSAEERWQKHSEIEVLVAHAYMERARTYGTVAGSLAIADPEKADRYLDEISGVVEDLKCLMMNRQEKDNPEITATFAMVCFTAVWYVGCSANLLLFASHEELAKLNFERHDRIFESLKGINIPKAWDFVVAIPISIATGCMNASLTYHVSVAELLERGKPRLAKQHFEKLFETLDYIQQLSSKSWLKDNSEIYRLLAKSCYTAIDCYVNSYREFSLLGIDKESAVKFLGILQKTLASLNDVSGKDWLNSNEEFRYYFEGACHGLVRVYCLFAEKAANDSSIRKQETSSVKSWLEAKQTVGVRCLNSMPIFPNNTKLANLIAEFCIAEIDTCGRAALVEMSIDLEEAQKSLERLESVLNYLRLWRSQEHWQANADLKNSFEKAFKFYFKVSRLSIEKDDYEQAFEHLSKLERVGWDLQGFGYEDYTGELYANTVTKLSVVFSTLMFANKEKAKEYFERLYLALRRFESLRGMEHLQDNMEIQKSFATACNRASWFYQPLGGMLNSEPAEAKKLLRRLDQVLKKLRRLSSGQTGTNREIQLNFAEACCNAIQVYAPHVAYLCKRFPNQAPRYQRKLEWALEMLISLCGHVQWRADDEMKRFFVSACTQVLIAYGAIIASVCKTAPGLAFKYSKKYGTLFSELNNQCKQDQWRLHIRVLKPDVSPVFYHSLLDVTLFWPGLWIDSFGKCLFEVVDSSWDVLSGSSKARVERYNRMKKEFECINGQLSDLHQIVRRNQSPPKDIVDQFLPDSIRWLPFDFGEIQAFTRD